MVSRCCRKNSLCHLVCVQASIDLQNIGTQLIICNVKSMRHQAEKIFMNKGCHLTLCLPPDKNLSYLREFPKTRGEKMTYSGMIWTEKTKEELMSASWTSGETAASWLSPDFSSYWWAGMKFGAHIQDVCRMNPNAFAELLTVHIRLTFVLKHTKRTGQTLEKTPEL